MEENKTGIARKKTGEKDVVLENLDRARDYANALLAVMRNEGMNFKNYTEQFDVESAAYLGLHEARKHFEENICNEFWHFASTYVKKYVLDEIRYMEYGRRRKEDVDEYILFDDCTDEDGESTLDGVMAEISVAEQAVEELRKWQDEQAAKRIGRLTDMQKKVVRLLFGFDGEAMTVQEVAVHLGVTADYVSKVKNQALRMMEG